MGYLLKETCPDLSPARMTDARLPPGSGALGSTCRLPPQGARSTCPPLPRGHGTWSAVSGAGTTKQTSRVSPTWPGGLPTLPGPAQQEAPSSPLKSCPGGPGTRPASQVRGNQWRVGCLPPRWASQPPSDSPRAVCLWSGSRPRAPADTTGGSPEAPARVGAHLCSQGTAGRKRPSPGDRILTLPQVSDPLTSAPSVKWTKCPQLQTPPRNSQDAEKRVGVLSDTNPDRGTRGRRDLTGRGPHGPL